VWPEKSGVLLNDGRALPYDYLVIATGPKLAFDEIKRLPARSRECPPLTQSTAVRFWTATASEIQARSQFPR
jgi:NADPH-dependent 2,4-dienoyl-CoA reductase/sulfur reductase-like enzyme